MSWCSQVSQKLVNRYIGYLKNKPCSREVSEGKYANVFIIRVNAFIMPALNIFIISSLGPPTKGAGGHGPLTFLQNNRAFCFFQNLLLRVLRFSLAPPPHFPTCVEAHERRPKFACTSVKKCLLKIPKLQSEGLL